MQRYLVEISEPDGETAVAAVLLAARRYPEVTVEATYVTMHEPTARSIWLCVAPNDDHIRRWTAAAELDVLRLTCVVRS